MSTYDSVTRLMIWTVVVILSTSSVGKAQENPSADSPRFILEWGSSGSEPGQFHSPVCIAISSEDEVFVADLNNARVQQFTADGAFVSEFALPLDDPARHACMVGGMAVGADGCLYLAFMIQHHIGVYSKQGERLRQWGQRGSEAGEFNQPGGVMITADGLVIVADQCNHRLQEFSTNGDFLRAWGEHGAEVGQFGATEPAGSRFGGPHFVTQDRLGRLYTTECAAGRVQQMDSNGSAIAVWGSKSIEPGAFGEYQFGNLKNSFGPVGIFADHQNRIWVSSLNDRVQCFTPDGQLLYRLDGTGPGDSFSHPHGIAADSQGFLYIADSGNQRIVKFWIGKTETVNRK